MPLIPPWIRIRLARSPARLALFVLVTSIAGSGCSSDETKPAAAQPAQCDGTLESLRTNLFLPRCGQSGCHDATSPSASLDLTAPDLEAELVGVSSGTCDGWTRVAAGDPQKSLLWHKLYGVPPPCGDLMPIGGPLSALELDCVRQWIRSTTPADAGPGCETCGTASCVSLQADPSRCGSCSNTCPAGASCTSGQCQCAVALSLCGTACVDLEASRDHCGACDQICPSGALCSASRCLCPNGLELCDSACADVASDANNCGVCGRICATNEVCLAGTCSAGCGTLTQCDRSCVDTASSSFHCGACGNACPLGASCVAGQCRCPAGTSACNGTCINTISDPSNCGGCGTVCAAGLTCESASCKCPGGGSLCAGACVDTSADERHCGGCDRACGAGQSCTDGACRCSAAPVAFSTGVQPILTQNCATRGCHSGTRPQEDLDLTAGKAWGELVGVAATQCSGQRVLVVAGNPAASYLMQKLLGSNLCTGSQMPKAGQSLPQQQLDAIGGWICAGALND